MCRDRIVVIWLTAHDDRTLEVSYNVLFHISGSVAARASFASLFDATLENQDAIHIRPM